MNVCSGRRRRGLCIIYLSLQFLNNRCPTNLCTAGCRGSGEGERSGACFSECRGSQCFAVDFLAHWPFSVLLQSSLLSLLWDGPCPMPALAVAGPAWPAQLWWQHLPGSALSCSFQGARAGRGVPAVPSRERVPCCCAVGHRLPGLVATASSTCKANLLQSVGMQNVLVSQEREFSFIKSARLLVGVTHGPAHLATRLCLTQTRDDTLLHPTGCKQPTEIAEVSLLL